jgi:hypothetical protein
MKKEVVQGAVLASTVVALLGASAAFAQNNEKPKETAKSVHCGGINACKGKGACNGAKNSCSGQNACKGQGWLPAKDEKECKAKHGKVVS